MLVECTCRGCGAVFTETPGRVREGRGKYCSRACQSGHLRVSRTCVTCGRAFTVLVSKMRREARSGEGRYCSNECRPGPRRMDRTCRTCGVVFAAKPSEVTRYGGIYCSKACYHTARPVAARLEERTTRTPTCWLWARSLTR